MSVARTSPDRVRRAKEILAAAPGRAGRGLRMVRNEHGIYVDQQGQIWVGGNDPRPSDSSVTPGRRTPDADPAPAERAGSNSDVARAPWANGDRTSGERLTSPTRYGTSRVIRARTRRAARTSAMGARLDASARRRQAPRGTPPQSTACSRNTRCTDVRLSTRRLVLRLRPRPKTALQDSQGRTFRSSSRFEEK